MRKKRKQRKLIFGFIGAIAIILIIFFLFSIFNNKTHIVLQGECGLVMGNLMNKIETEDSCRVQCLNECIAIDKDMSKSVFISGGETGCNSCDCYCSS